MDDELLFQARNALYIGAYAATTADAVSAGLAQLGRGENPQAATNSATRLLKFLHESVASDEALAAAREALADSLASSNYDTRFIAALILAKEAGAEEAFKVASKTALEKHLDSAALLVYLYLFINRIDLATKQLSTITAWSTDSALVQLCEAWVNVLRGGSVAIQEAFDAIEELAQTYNANALLLNNMAVCHLASDKVLEAEKFLLDAHQKDPKNADVLANLITVYSLQAKPTDRFLTLLTQQSPKHQLVQEYRQKNDMFDRLVTKFA